MKDIITFEKFNFHIKNPFDMNDESINVREDENNIKKDFNKSTYINTINISSSNTNNKTL